MGATTLVSVEEYLNTSYHPDREYIDGEIVERNLGEKVHSRIQGKLISYLDNRSHEFRIEVFPAQRVQVSPTRFRTPDIAVMLLPVSDEPIVTSPPFLCIEIVSKDDTMQYMLEKVDDYLNFGVPYVWIINPLNKKAHVVTRAAGWVEARSGALETKNPNISVPLSILFE